MASRDWDWCNGEGDGCVDVVVRCQSVVAFCFCFVFLGVSGDMGRSFTHILKHVPNYTPDLTRALFIELQSEPQRGKLGRNRRGSHTFPAARLRKRGA